MKIAFLRSTLFLRNRLFLSSKNSLFLENKLFFKYNLFLEYSLFLELVFKPTVGKLVIPMYKSIRPKKDCISSKFLAAGVA
jgi:hypothetical protein